MIKAFREGGSMIDLHGKSVVFISFWGVSDYLTVATVFPQISILQQHYQVKNITLYTIERNKEASATATKVNLPGVVHRPLFSSDIKFSLLNKIADFTAFPRQIAADLEREASDVVLAHSAPAGALAYLVWKRTGVPFVVTSFEPHASYMLESGTWKRIGLKYQLQSYWEKQQLKHAAGIATASESYRKVLIASGWPAEKLWALPCTVDTALFVFSEKARAQTRELLSWADNTIGIYVGKYGDLYYREEAYEIYRQCFTMMPDFRLIILSPQSESEILPHLIAKDIDPAKVFIASVPHDQVPAYLSAADFAFATYKPGASKMNLSPIKIGEYWANGLPVFLTEGVGDDSDIIKNEGGGALFNLQQAESVEQGLRKIQAILQDPNHRQDIPKLAKKYRSTENIKDAYNYFFGKLEGVNQ